MSTEDNPCMISVDGKVLDEVDNFCYLGTLITSDAQCSKGIKSRLSKGQYVSAGLNRIWQSHDIAVATKVRLLKALVCPVAVYGCESWTLRTADEKRIQAFEMRGLRHILCVSWTAKCTNDWVLDKAEVSRNLLESVKARKLTYFGHVMRSSSESLEKQIMQRTTPGSRKRGRPKTMWMENIFHWTGYTLDNILMYSEDRVRWRQLVHVWPSLGARTAEGKARQGKASLMYMLCQCVVFCFYMFLVRYLCSNQCHLYLAIQLSCVAL